MAHGIGQGRRGAVRIEQKHLQPAGGEDLGGELGEFPRAVSRIVSHDRFASTLPVPAFLQVTGHAVGGLGDGAFVDRGGSELRHPPPPAARSEGNHFPKQKIEFLKFPGLDHFHEPALVGGVLRFRKPTRQIFAAFGGEFFLTDGFLNLLQSNGRAAHC